jgi:hypothetical protein
LLPVTEWCGDLLYFFTESARGYVSRAEFAEFDDVGLWWKEVMIFKFDYDPEIDRWERGWQTSHTHTSWQRLEYISLVDIRGQIK